jgi:hypothetical protein
VTSSSSSADPMTASSADNPGDRSTAEPPLLGPVVRGVTPPASAPAARAGSFVPPFAATAPPPATRPQPEPGLPGAEPEPVVDVPVAEEPVALAGAEDAWDDEALEEALASGAEGDVAGPELEFLDGGAWPPDAAVAGEPAPETAGAEAEPEPAAPWSEPSVADPEAGWWEAPAEPGVEEEEAVAEVEAEPAAAADEPLAAEMETLPPGDEERDPAELPAAVLLEEPAPEAADGSGPPAPGEPEPERTPVADREPGLAEVAGRLERLAAALRQGAPPPIPAADGSADPLEVLITGYALGYAEALRHRRPPPAG